jgi:predicted AlkP superfamily phosphohydrolase/phosphomutase
MDNKLLLIGLDGASFNVLDDLNQKGLIPNIAGLIRRGVRANLRTTFPPITAVAWSSLVTGKNPGKHGIFEFMLRDRDSKRELAVNATFRQGPALWDLLSGAGNRIIVHNFPCTYPPHAINGIMIADFMTPRGRRDFACPSHILPELESRFGPYRLHLNQTYARGGAEGVLEELTDELEYKARVTEYLMTHYKWDAFFQYFWGTDRIQHELWHVIDPSHPRHDPREARLYGDRVYGYFSRVDEIIGGLIERAGDGATVWVVSDHGFGPVHKYCSFNIWLLEEGFLKLKRGAAARVKKLMFDMGLTPELAFKLVKKMPVSSFRPARGAASRPSTSKLLSALFLSFNDVDWTRTLAFAKGNYGQIYINLKGREPDGVVEQDQYESVRERIIERLSRIRHPETGRQWVGEIYRREELYSGSRVADAPDIAFLPADMRYLPLGNTDFTSNKFMVDAFGISGCHRMDGVLIASGPGIRPDVDIERASIYDVAPTLLYLLGQEVREDMDGSVLEQIILQDRLKTEPIRYGVAGESQASDTRVAFDDDENAQISESLKNLGYMG